MEAAEFGAVLGAVRGFDKTLSARLRIELEQAGDPAVKDVRQTLMMPPPGGGRASRGLRTGLAAGTSIRGYADPSRGTSGIAITTSGAKLGDGHRPMVLAYNKAQWSHPVYGRGRVTQRGRPYFGSVISKHTHKFLSSAETAINRAADTIKIKASR